MIYDVRKGEINIISLVASTSGGVNIQISLVPGSNDINIGPTDIQKLCQVLVYDPGLKVEFASGLCRYLVEWRAKNELTIAGITNTDLFVLSDECVNKLFDILDPLVCGLSSPPSLSSSQTNSQIKNQFEVVVGQSLLYPVDIATTIQETTEYYSVNISSAYILLDFLKQPLGPLNFEKLTLSTAQGKCELSLTSTSFTIKNLTTGILCCFIEKDVNDLLCALQAAMQKHFSHQANSPREYFLDSSTSQWENTDPLAGARKRTNDNLSSVFG